MTRRRLTRGTWRSLLTRLAEGARSSLWLVPVCLIVIAVAASWASLRLDEIFGMSWALRRAFPAGAEGARATLSVIASSVMTVGGVSFSITIVAVQLSASQFSPRVIRRYLRSRTIQFVLGAYIGTFTFALLVLRAVESDRGDASAVVPTISVAVAIALAVFCMVLLVVFIHHIATAMQVASVVGNIAAETRAAALHLYPEELGDEERRGHGERAGAHVDAAASVAAVIDADPGDDLLASSSGYLENVDEKAFDELPDGAILRVLIRPGEYAHEGDVIARLHPRGLCDASLLDHVAQAFSFYAERTIRQDVAFGIRLIVDVALRALSPSMNDPTTAMTCVTSIASLLRELGGRRMPGPVRVREGRDVRIVSTIASYGELLRLGFWQIVRCGAAEYEVQLAVIAALRSLRDDAARLAPVELAALFHMIEEQATTAPWPEEDRARLCRAARSTGTPLPDSSSGIARTSGAGRDG